MFKNKANAVTALCAALTIIITMNRQSDAAEDDWIPKGSLSISRYDKYLGNRVSRVLSEQPAMWYELNLQWPCGLLFSWTEIHGTDDSDWSTGTSDETLVSGGYTWNQGPWKFKLLATIVNLHPIERWLDNDRWAFEGFVSRTWKFEALGSHSVTPELRLGWFADSQKLGKGVPIVIPTLYHLWDSPFGIRCVAIQSRVAIAWDGGLYKNDADGIFFQAETGLQWKVNKGVTITLPGIKTFVPISNHINDGREDNSNTFFASIKMEF